MPNRHVFKPIIVFERSVLIILGYLFFVSFVTFGGYLIWQDSKENPFLLLDFYTNRSVQQVIIDQVCEDESLKDKHLLTIKKLKRREKSKSSENYFNLIRFEEELVRITTLDKQRVREELIEAQQTIDELLLEKAKLLAVLQDSKQLYEKKEENQ